MVDANMIECIIMLLIAVVYGIVIIYSPPTQTDRPDIPPPGLW
jgi:hypothetical protein